MILLETVDTDAKPAQLLDTIPKPLIAKLNSLHLENNPLNFLKILIKFAQAHLQLINFLVQIIFKRAGLSTAFCCDVF